MSPHSLQTEVRVMFFDTDAGRVVHNIAYLRFIEINRCYLAELLGWRLDSMMDAGDCPVVVRTEIDYRCPARLWDHLIVNGALESFERSRFWCSFTITRPSDNQLIVTCRQMLTLVKLPDMTVMRLPARWQEEFGHLAKRAKQKVVGSQTE